MNDKKDFSSLINNAKGKPVKMVPKKPEVALISLATAPIQSTLGQMQIGFFALGDDDYIYTWDGGSQKWLISEEAQRGKEL